MATLIDEEEDHAREATPEEVEDIERDLGEDRGSDLAGSWHVTPWDVEEAEETR